MRFEKKISFTKLEVILNQQRVYEEFPYNAGKKVNLEIFWLVLMKLGVIFII